MLWSVDGIRDSTSWGDEMRKQCLVTAVVAVLSMVFVSSALAETERLVWTAPGPPGPEVPGSYDVTIDAVDSYGNVAQDGFFDGIPNTIRGYYRDPLGLASTVLKLTDYDEPSTRSFCYLASGLIFLFYGEPYTFSFEITDPDGTVREVEKWVDPAEVYSGKASLLLATSPPSATYIEGTAESPYGRCKSPDTDDDSVEDDRDRCPAKLGLMPSGCPDSDGDGLVDPDDRCPAEAGIMPSGCPDSDGDGFADFQDGCPKEFGAKPNGCPINVSRKISLSYSVKSKKFVGKLTSKFAECRKSRVSVYKVNSGKDPKVKSTRANGNTGVWSAKHPRPLGRYYAGVQLTAQGEYLCQAATSKTLRIGRSKNR